MPFISRNIRIFFASVFLISYVWIGVYLENNAIYFENSIYLKRRPFPYDQSSKLEQALVTDSGGDFKPIGIMIRSMLLDTTISAGYYEHDGQVSSNYLRVTDDFVSRRTVEKMLMFFANDSCPQTYNSAKHNASNTVVCNAVDDKHHHLIMFTTMFHSESSSFMFYNTLRVFSSLHDDFNVKPVMFIENTSSFTGSTATTFIQDACNMGWTVLLAPHCNEYGYPVFKSMFDVAMSTWDAEWYGYMNADMLFDASLLQTIEFIESKSDVITIPMLVGRRYNVEVSTD